MSQQLLLMEIFEKEVKSFSRVSFNILRTLVEMITLNYKLKNPRYVTNLFLTYCTTQLIIIEYLGGSKMFTCTNFNFYVWVWH